MHSETLDNSHDRRKEASGQGTPYLGDHFERRMDHYGIILVSAPELMKIYAKMRHQVYCEEHPEHGLSSSLNAMEYDEHDAHSLHFLCLYEPLHMIVGGVRVILPREDVPHFGLPSVEAEGSYFQQGFPYDLSKFCEISRFLLVKERMKIVRAHQAEKDVPENYPDVFRHLVRTVFSVCQQKGLMGFVATLEESLFRRAKYFFGISMTKYGEVFDYHGKRQGGYIVLDDALEEFRNYDLKVYNFIKDGFIENLDGGAHGQARLCALDAT